MTTTTESQAITFPQRMTIPRGRAAELRERALRWAEDAADQFSQRPGTLRLLVWASRHPDGAGVFALIRAGIQTETGILPSRGVVRHASLFLHGGPVEYHTRPDLDDEYARLAPALRDADSREPALWRCLLDDLRQRYPDLAKAVAVAVVDSANKGGKRRRKRQSKPNPPTDKEVEALYTVGECKGNIAEAARRLGKHRKTVQEQSQAALRKTGVRASMMKPKTESISSDRRGQADIAGNDDGQAVYEGGAKPRAKRDHRG